MEWLVLILLIPYICYITAISISLRKLRGYKESVTSEVFISIVVACRNEERNLPHLLSHIAGQDYSSNSYELILADDNSTDSTFKIASEFQGIKNIKVLKSSSRGKKMAVAEGVIASSGNIIVTTDADCTMNPGWLRTISSFWNSCKPDLVSAPVDLPRSKGFFQGFQEIEFLSLQGITAGSAAAGNPVMCNGANMIFTRDAFLKSSEDLHPELVSGDDIFLLQSIRSRSGKISWLESIDAMVTTGSSGTLKDYLKQRARWISKAGAYRDNYIKVLAIVTFVTILLQLTLLAAGFFNPVFFLVFLAVFVIKSVPDMLILYNRMIFHKKKNLLWFFVPAQLIYPFYVLSVVIFWFFTRSEYST